MKTFKIRTVYQINKKLNAEMQLNEKYIYYK